MVTLQGNDSETFVNTQLAEVQTQLSSSRRTSTLPDADVWQTSHVVVSYREVVTTKEGIFEALRAVLGGKTGHIVESRV
jgi:hypothetical protein